MGNSTTEKNGYTYPHSHGGVLASMAATSASSASTTTNLCRPHPYQQGVTSTVNHQTPPSFIRSDRRSLAGLSMMPSAPSNPSNAAVSKHRYGGRKLVPNARTGSIAETDWRSNNLSASENDVQARIANSNTFEMRGESHPNSGLKRRTLSATTLRTVQDLTPSVARINPRLNVANYASMTDSQTNLASQCGAVPYATAQQYMCSMYALPNTKVTQQQQSVMNLSVISGPAPVTYRPDPTGQVGTTQQAGLRDNNLPSHRLTTTGSSALR